MRRHVRLLFVLGDIALLYTSLWVTLVLRNGSVEVGPLFYAHVLAFTPVFVIWMIVFLVMGLYEKHITVFKYHLPLTIVQTQIINTLIATVLFYTLPVFDIAPKTFLLIYVIVSSSLMILWRMHGPRLFKENTVTALLITPVDQQGVQEFDELEKELVREHGYPIVIVKRVVAHEALAQNLRQEVSSLGVGVVIASTHSSVPVAVSRAIYNVVTEKKILFLEFSEIYEEVFGRLPIHAFDEQWFIQHISLAPRGVYGFVKRCIDISLAIIAAFPAIIIFPFVAMAIKIQDKGPLFFSHYRVGEWGKQIKMYKFRSMSVHDEKDGLAKQPHVTRVGALLRKTRIDELPQLFNVLKGDVSLIGPRPELPTLVDLYKAEIPYYMSRHSVKPGLSGWAQINQKEPPKMRAAVELTREKLSYDLYYVKNRSLQLDVLIGLRTIKDLLLTRGI